MSEPQHHNTNHPDRTHSPAFDPKAIDALSYEQAIERLEAIIDKIESGDIGLEESVAAYEEGIALKNHCEKIHNRAEQRVRELTADHADLPPAADDADPDASA